MESAPAQLWRQSRRGQLLFRVAIGAWVGVLEVLLTDDYGDGLAPKLDLVAPGIATVSFEGNGKSFRVVPLGCHSSAVTFYVADAA